MKRKHRCQLCGQIMDDTPEDKFEHFQMYHRKPQMCVCNICGEEFIDNLENRQLHSRKHIENHDEIKLPLYHISQKKSGRVAEVRPIALKKLKGKKGGKGGKGGKGRDIIIGKGCRIIYNGIETKRRRH